ncbi:hypothetical protein, partial [Kibdelosporangium philippinense]|uniref:hypothetical protein n=1 Tax=Kibdelosporangium philippinense TaxID=211113 RepID=UPI0035F080EE
IRVVAATISRWAVVRLVVVVATVRWGRMVNWSRRYRHRVLVRWRRRPATCRRISRRCPVVDMGRWGRMAGRSRRRSRPVQVR